MKNQKFLWIILLIISLGIPSLFASEDTTSAKQSPPEKRIKTDKINWESYDIGLKDAKEKNKHVFIDFFTSWCGWCKKMDREVFNDSKVIDILNNDFIPVRVNGDSKKVLNVNGYKVTEKNLTKYEFGVRGYPTFWFLKPDGSKLTTFSGYRPTDYMIKALTFIKDYKYDTTKTKNGKNKK
ncbi:MAG: thioredoxin family protein [FCB group bacterium]|nr:thioredoxin family protein [FCB group bacterium]